MKLSEALERVAESVPETIASFQQRLSPEWIEQALTATGTATLRRRRLPAEQVVWLVLGMAIMRDRCIEEVVAKLDLALPAPGRASVAPASIPQARSRLGPDPMRWLFERTGQVWAAEGADANRWRGLAIYGVDGTSLRVADSVENRATFGGQYAGADKGDSGYPMLRVVALMSLRTHVLAGAAIGGYATTDEQSLTAQLTAQIPDDSLTIFDRNFLSPLTLGPLSRGGANRHWLTRTKSNTAYEVTERLADGSELVEMKVSSYARAADPTLGKTWRGRVIHYQRKGFKPQRLLTSLLDADKYPAAELIAMYHERWEIELGYREIKTDMLLRLESLRSKKPESVMQEAWGVLLAYNLIRLEIARVAQEVGLPPVRISFVLALMQIRDEWMWSALSDSPGAIPKKLKRLRDDLKRFVLPPRRSERSYPRAVKIKMSNYARKRPTTVAELK